MTDNQVNGWRVVGLDSWGEWIDLCSRLPKTAITQRDSRTAADGWAGGSYMNAMRLAVAGWPEGQEMAEKLADPIFNQVVHMMILPEIVYDVEGGDFDLTSYINGDPECWTRYQLPEFGAKIHGAGPGLCKVVLNGFYSASIDQQAIMARGAAIAALVNLMEFAGIRCEVRVGVSFFEEAKSQKNLVFDVPVKSYDQPLDLSRLMFAVAHPAMFRRLGFSALEQYPENYQSYYGWPCTLPSELTFNADLDFENMSAYEQSTKWADPEMAQQWVIETMKQQGVEFASVE